MSTETLLADRDIQAADDFFVVELYYPTANPPYHAADDLPTFEGGVVGSATGDTVTLSLARQVINVTDRSDSYQTSFGQDQTGRSMIVRSGALAGNVYAITDSGAMTLTCDGEDLSSMAAGDVVVIGDRLQLVPGARCSRDIDTMSAQFGGELAWDGDALPAAKIKASSWIYWRQKCDGNGETTGWYDMGWFRVTLPPKGKRPDPYLGINAGDALADLAVQPWTGSFAQDVIEAHERATNTVGSRCVVLKKIDETTGDDGMFRFLDSPEATAAKVLVNHTTHWCVLPPPVLYASADTNDTISAGDRLVPPGQGIDILYGTGEVRVQSQTWNDSYVDESLPNLKAQYSRYATYLDQTVGTSTTVAAAVLTDSTRTGALVWPTTGVGLTGMTLRATSGYARGKTFTIASNTANSITATESLTDAEMVTGDTYEVHAINDPRRIIEDLLLKTDFQMRDANRALYVADLDEILVPGYAEQVLFYNGSTYTDLTAAAQDETSTSDTLDASGEILYLGHPNRFLIPKLWLGAPWTSGAGVWEYWNGSAWTTAELTGFVDGTAELTVTGAVHVPLLSDWRPTTVNSGDEAYFLRYRCTSTPSGALGLDAIEIMGRPSAPPPSEAEWMEAYDEDDAKPAEFIQQLRQNGLVPPNWILLVDREGVVQGSEIVQATAAEWTCDILHTIEELVDPASIKTGVLVRGQSYDTSNIAVRDTGVTIEQTTELQAKITANTVLPGTSNDHSVHSLYGIISNVDERMVNGWVYVANGQLAGVPADWQAADITGPQLRLRWGYATGENASDQRELDNLPLWIVDLGQSYSDISEVAIVIDNGAHPWMNRAQTHAGDKPIFALEVSSDKSSWVPLCDTAAAQAIREQGKLSEYLYTSGDSRFQRTFRYLRKKCVIGGWITQGRTAGQVRESGQVVVLKVRRSGELQQTLYLGDDIFDAGIYATMRRRFRRRLLVDQVLDPSADTDDRIMTRARKRLRESLYRSPDISVDSVRPDVNLFETVAVTDASLGIDAEHLITSISLGSGGMASLTMRNYRLS